MGASRSVLDETYHSILDHLPTRSLRVVDMGANIGAFLVWLHQKRGIKESFGFEPDSENFSLCKFNLDHNGLSDVHLDKRGIGGKTREAEIWIDAERPARSSLHRKPTNPTAKTQIIHILALDGWLRGVHGNFDLLKMDIEGSEWEIIDACPAVFTRFNVIVAEVHTHFGGKHEVGDFAAVLAQTGFTTLRWDGHPNGLYIGCRNSLVAKN